MGDTGGSVKDQGAEEIVVRRVTITTVSICSMYRQYLYPLFIFLYIIIKSELLKLISTRGKVFFIQKKHLLWEHKSTFLMFI